MILDLGAGQMEFLFPPGECVSVGAIIHHKPRRHGRKGKCSVTVWWGPNPPAHAKIRDFTREPRYEVTPPFRCPACLRRLAVLGGGLVDV